MHMHLGVNFSHLPLSKRLKYISDLALECFEKSCKGQPLMPLNSLGGYSVLYCGSSPNTAAHRQIRSVSPFKDITIWSRSSGRQYMWLLSIYTKVFITIVWLLCAGPMVFPLVRFSTMSRMHSES